MAMLSVGDAHGLSLREDSRLLFPVVDGEDEDERDEEEEKTEEMKRAQLATITIR
jgi:hypothetical protein